MCLFVWVVVVLFGSLSAPCGRYNIVLLRLGCFAGIYALSGLECALSCCGFVGFLGFCPVLDCQFSGFRFWYRGLFVAVWFGDGISCGIGFRMGLV